MSGLISRWRCLAVRAREHLERIGGEHHRFIQREAFVRALPAHAKGHAFEQRHDHEWAAVFVDVVVDHRHRARMPHPFGDIGLTDEESVNLGIVLQAAVQEFDRDPVPIAVGRAIHRAIPPTPRRPVDSVFLLNHRAETRQRAFRNR